MPFLSWSIQDNRELPSDSYRTKEPTNSRMIRLIPIKSKVRSGLLDLIINNFIQEYSMRFGVVNLKRRVTLNGCSVEFINSLVSFYRLDVRVWSEEPSVG